MVKEAVPGRSERPQFDSQPVLNFFLTFDTFIISSTLKTLEVISGPKIVMEKHQQKQKWLNLAIQKLPSAAVDKATAMLEG